MSSKLEYNNTAPTYNGGFALSTMKDGKRVFSRNVEYVGFTLQSVIPEFSVGYALVEKEIGEGDDKKTVVIAVYEDGKLNYCQEALTAKIEAAAKGRINGGNEPYATLEEILETTGGGQYKKLVSEFKQAMVAYLQALEIPEALQAAVVKLLEPEVLKATSAANKGKVDKLVEGFATANPEYAAKYSSVIKRVKEAAEESAELDLSSL